MGNLVNDSVCEPKSDNMIIDGVSPSEYGYSITSITSDEKSIFCISGKFNVRDVNEMKSCKLLVRRRDSGHVVEYDGKLEGRNEELFFSFEVDARKLNRHLSLNSIWDTYVQLLNTKNEIVLNSSAILNDENNKSRSDRYLQNLEISPGQILTLHVTESKNNLAFWYVDKKRFETIYQYAIGKEQYYNDIEEEPINEKMVIFESFLGKQYTGNPKYIYEEMLRDPRFADFKFVWSISKEKWFEIPGDAMTVERGSSEYFKALAVAKYWVNNAVFPIQYKRDGAVYLQTWHGTPLKKLVFDIEFEGPETLGRENFYSKSLGWDYLIAQNEFSRETFKRAFRFDKEILVDGYPINDIFYHPDIKYRMMKIKEKLGIPLEKKVILYAPTWRDNEVVGAWSHSFSVNFDIDKMRAKFSDEYVLVLRMHHLISSKLVIEESYRDFVIDCSSYSDIQELYAISDVLITDYSSVFFDFANTKKPILFYAHDYEVYRDEIRGFYLDMETDLPGPLLRTTDDLFLSIEKIDLISQEYVDRYDRFCKRFCTLDDGRAAKRIIDKVFVKNSGEMK